MAPRARLRDARHVLAELHYAGTKGSSEAGIDRGRAPRRKKRFITD